MTVTIPNTTVNTEYNIKELTSLDGNGVFDVMMGSVRTIIKEEYEAGRIRGTDYANVLTQSIIQVLDQASRYALAKSKLALELQLLEAEITKIATDTAVATKQGALIEAQANKEMAEINRINADLTIRLPAEIKKMEADTKLSLAEIKLKEKQLPLLEEELKIKKAQLEINLKEVLIKEKQIPLMEKEIEYKGKQIDMLAKEIILKEKQIPIMEKELDLKSKQVDIAGKELDIKTEQLEITKYELEHKLPADVGLINTQKDLYAQKTKTEEAQTNGDNVQPNSVIHYQNQLLQEQAKTYIRDAQQKLAKILVDTWSVRRNSDPDSNAVDTINKLHDPSIGKVIEAVGADIGITL